MTRGWALIFLALLVAAASAEPIRKVLPPEVREVYIDAAGRAVMETAGDDWRATAEAVYSGQASTISGARILVIDRKHRIWLRPDDDKARATIHCYDGKAWTVRRVSDLPADANRKLDGIAFIRDGVEDAAGNVWFVDGQTLQGWWLHQLSPAGKWSGKMLNERALAAVRAAPKPRIHVLDFAEPDLQIGPDGLFYACWQSSKLEGVARSEASGFLQFDGSNWSEYFYPFGSSQSDNVQGIIPLPDGSVGFLRKVEEPRIVWMTSAIALPPPDLSKQIERLASLSSRERESAQAELIAMGPRIRKALQSLVAEADEPEVKLRLPVILQEISKPPPKGIYGGKLSFTSWKPVYQAKSGRVYIAVKNCIDKPTGREFREALVTVSPAGVWSAEESPTTAYKKPISMLEVCEDSKGRRWDRIAGEGIFLRDPAAPTATLATSDDSLGHLLGCDADGRLYLRAKEGIVVFNPAGTNPQR